MKPPDSHYDVVIVGAGHNGLVAAGYLSRAGLSVLMLERNETVGGATKSARVFPDFDANLSVYAYLVSLFPRRICDDLGLKLKLKRRRIASYTPELGPDGEIARELLVNNDSESVTRESFERLTGNDRDYRGYQKLQAMQQRIADLVWPTLTGPLPRRSDFLSKLQSPEERDAWTALIEEPLGNVIEKQIGDDLIRGMLFTDAKIGVSTWPHDPSLLQNRTFLYHIVGRGTGEWMTPAGGMGVLVDQLETGANKQGVRIVTGAEVCGIETSGRNPEVGFQLAGGSFDVKAKFVLWNAAPAVLDRLTGRQGESDDRDEDEGSVFKANLLLKKLPQLRSNQVSGEDAFTGTFHIDEGYERMTKTFRQSRAGELPDRPPFEIYCHSLTDDTILSEELRIGGFHTLTCFGIDAPWRLFGSENENRRDALQESVLRGIQQFLAEPLEDCLARDADGNPCLEIKTPVDLEDEIHLPRGNIFHNALSWPFAEDGESEPGQWGVETDHDLILLCGSGAKRGGCVSGISGHNAAMKVLETLGLRAKA